MHDSIMAQMDMDHEEQHHQFHDRTESSAHDSGYGGNEGWADLSHNYNLSSQQSPAYEQSAFTFMQTLHDINIISTDPYITERMASAPQPQATQQHQHEHHQHLLPVIIPSHSTWPSMLTNQVDYSPQVTLPRASAPVSAAKGAVTKLVASSHSTPSPRKTLTDSDRRRMCQYHEEHPSVKQTEIGAMFGVERSTVSKVLRQREKYLFPEDRSLSPVKRAKGKFPDIERALSNWVRNSQRQGLPLTDAAIKEKARFFAATVGNNENHVRTNSTSWLEKFKQKNGIGSSSGNDGKPTRRASETNIFNDSESSRRSTNPNSAVVGGAASHNTGRVSPSCSPRVDGGRGGGAGGGEGGGAPLPPSPLSATQGEDGGLKSSEHRHDYTEFSQSSVDYNLIPDSQSSTTLAGALSNPSPTSPTTITSAFAFANNSSWLSASQQVRLPSSNATQRPRSQTFPMLGIEPSFIGPTEQPMSPEYDLPVTAPSSLDTPTTGFPQGPCDLDSAISPSSHVHRRSSSSDESIAPLPLHPTSATIPSSPPSSSGTPMMSLPSPHGSSVPSSPTQDDARRALDTLLNFFSQEPNNSLVDPSEYLIVLKLTEKMRLQQALPGGLHRITEQEIDLHAPKLEQSMSAGC